AWNLFIARDTSSEAFLLLQLIANECYKCEEFWFAAKAFDMLEKLDPSPENWEGKRGACAGVLFATITKYKKMQMPHSISEVIGLLRESSYPQAETIIRTIRKYANILK
ncbi:intraflagellar transport protein 56-like, partial [Teleopsis dalmanni]